MIRHFSAGGIVYNKVSGQTLFLLRKSNPTTSFYSAINWSLPKGWLDDEAPGRPGPKTLGQKRATTEEVEQVALREVREETGVEAKIISRLGTDQFYFVDQNKQKVFKTVIYFLMEFVRYLPEGFGSETSEIAWKDLVEASNLLRRRKGELELIKKAAALIV
jgi:8-oxo-dGTP pyrophosphatase MutT (NUDIX family)